MHLLLQYTLHIDMRLPYLKSYGRHSMQRVRERLPGTADAFPGTALGTAITVCTTTPRSSMSYHMRVVKGAFLMYW